MTVYISCDLIFIATYCSLGGYFVFPSMFCDGVGAVVACRGGDQRGMGAASRCCHLCLSGFFSSLCRQAFFPTPSSPPSLPPSLPSFVLPFHSSLPPCLPDFPLFLPFHPSLTAYLPFLSSYLPFLRSFLSLYLIYLSLPSIILSISPSLPSCFIPFSIYLYTSRVSFLPLSRLALPFSRPSTEASLSLIPCESYNKLINLYPPHTKALSKVRKAPSLLHPLYLYSLLPLFLYS